MHNKFKYIAIIIMASISNACHADNYYKDYYKRAIKIVIPEANAQQVPAEEIPKPTYKVPELKTDANAVAKAQIQPPNIAKPLQNHANNRIVNKNNSLDKKSKKGLLISEHLTNKDDISSIGVNGYVSFQYGQGQPTVICAVNNVCAIKLQDNERISSIKIGSQNEWQVQDVISRENNNLVTSITISPYIENVQTNLLVFTDRRQYNIRLLAHKTKYMPLITFRYNNDITSLNNNAWDLKYKIAEEKEKQQQKQNNQYDLNTKNLDFNYQINGNAPFKPIRIYTDNIKTYIEFPDAINGNELPIFISQTQDRKERLVNYKYDAENKKYIVDQKLRNGLLIAGNEKIEISYRGK